jgi:hypothetical protein
LFTKRFHGKIFLVNCYNTNPLENENNIRERKSNELQWRIQITSTWGIASLWLTSSIETFGVN